MPYRRTARIAVLISGGGSLLEPIATRSSGMVVQVLSSKAGVPGLERARRIGVEPVVVSRKAHADPRAFSDIMWSYLRVAMPDLVCLAGFLSLLEIPPDYAGRVINIHPALDLERFGGQGMYGRYVHEAVLKAGERTSGCTVHLCTNEYDRGEVILQRSCRVEPDDTPDALAYRVRSLEREAYPAAINEMIRRVANMS